MLFFPKKSFTVTSEVKRVHFVSLIFGFRDSISEVSLIFYFRHSFSIFGLYLIFIILWSKPVFGIRYVISGFQYAKEGF